MKTPDHQRKKATAVNDDRLNELLRSAREVRPDPSRVEFGFETRLLAKLREERAAKADAAWFSWAWRLGPAFAAVTLALGVWTWFSPPEITSNLVQVSGNLQTVEMFTGDQP